MTDLDLVSKNLWRKPLRTILLIVSIFIAFLIFSLLVGFNFAYEKSLNENTLANRMVVNNKINFTESMPISYVNRIARVEGVTDVSYQNWFGAYYQERARGAPMFGFAVDPESFLRVNADQVKLPEDQKKTFIADRQGVIVGKTLADRYGWKLGQKIPIKSDIYIRRDGAPAWDMRVSGIFTGKNPGDNIPALYFHWDYLNEGATFGQDQAGQIVILTASPEINDKVATAIDAMFANSSNETATVDEKTFSRSFLAQAGDINFIITMVVSAAFAAILMIVGNTMVTAVRERTKEIGVMKTLGFTGPRVLRMVLSESLLLSLIGAAFGFGVAWLALTALGSGGGPFGRLEMQPIVAAMALGLAILLGLITGLIPALSALRMNIIDALNRR
jgi:putative ABC transport system permease protein